MGSAGLEVEIVGRGRDLLCLHSLLSDKSSFQPLAQRIADRRRLILPNLPGFGASRSDSSTLEGLAQSVAGLFDDLRLSNDADVIGNGLGGFVALLLAARHGSRLSKAVLIGSAVAFPEAGRATFTALAEKAERAGMDLLAEPAMHRMFPQDFIAANPAVLADRAAVFRRIDPKIFAAAARELAALDLAPVLKRVRNPVLVVVGEKDGATPPALGRELAGRLSNAGIVVLPGLGHAPHVQDADAFVAAIADFLGFSDAPPSPSQLKRQ
jgi:3-oxoadipate enol-lactonase